MDLNFKNPIFIRITAIVISSFFLSWSLAKSYPFYVSLVLLVALAFLALDLMKNMDRSNEDLSNFFESLKFDDFSFSFKSTKEDKSSHELHERLNEAMSNLRELRQEKDAEFQYMKNIVQYVGIGLITFKKDGSIQLCNNAAKKLLRVNNIKNIQELTEVDQRLPALLQDMRTGSRELLRLNLGGDIIQLAMYVIELNVKGEDIKLVSLQNIQSELEEKEMEAWQNLVRVLTHEIMNSVTPISSLAGLVQDELQEQMEKKAARLSEDQLSDMHLSVQTISKRSEGLIAFIKEFRNLAQVPKPNLSDFAIKPLLEEIATLHKKELADAHIKLDIKIEPEDINLTADRAMIEQVLVNLVKNAIQSFEEEADKKIILQANYNEKERISISVKDNGQGIEPEVLERIFIPFFTTKKTGSGIGLSLSRQIMRQHKGSISVKSEIGKGTEFQLRF
ncbi:MAG TPA: ATP-binding protein [Cyclobacteriaceae bacterium]|nr:ATP-binding protein [Cyclobacteriaceae bacterium]